MPKSYPLEAALGRLVTPFQDFLARTTSGGIVLVVATIVALATATLWGAELPRQLWEAHLVVAAPGVFALEWTLHHWINDGLMALFFLLVGLELKREVQVGELATLRDAALPVIAAAGGIVVPSAIYSALNWGTPAVNGWAIPAATDIAFAVGILVLLSWRIPRSLIVFLTALAIADDLGAVLIIAVFYTEELRFGALGGAAACLGVLALLNRGGVRHLPAYLALGVVFWYFTYASGVHATLAGVLLALAIPARAASTEAQLRQCVGELREKLVAAGRRDAGAHEHAEVPALAAALERAGQAAQTPLERLEHLLAPWVTFAVIPLFALANTGIDLSAVQWAEALSSRVTLGVVLGLVVGKFAGITLFSWIAVRSGVARLPQGVTWRQLMGAAWLAGIGFTMSLFIAQLAFHDPALVEEAKLGILLASATAAVIGLAWLALAAGRRPVEG